MSILAQSKNLNEKNTTTVIALEPVLLSAKDAQRYLGVGGNVFWELTKDKRFGKGIVFGGRKRLWRTDRIKQFVIEIEREQEEKEEDVQQ